MEPIFQALLAAGLFLGGAFAQNLHAKSQAQDEPFCPTCLAPVNENGVHLGDFRGEGDE